MTRAVATTTVFVVVLVVATSVLAQDRTRVDLYDKENRHQGAVIVDEKNGRIDTYTPSGKHSGYGVIRQDGRVDLYNVDGKRKGSAASKPRR